MKTPIERLLDAADWKPLEPIGDVADSEAPHATHVGSLRIGDFDLTCFQLSNGKRVIAVQDLSAFLGVPDMKKLEAMAAISPAESP